MRGEVYPRELFQFIDDVCYCDRSEDENGFTDCSATSDRYRFYGQVASEKHVDHWVKNGWFDYS